MKDRYTDRTNMLKHIERDISTIQHLLRNHSRQLVLLDVINIYKIYTSVELEMDAVESLIEVDLKAKWIDKEEYEGLIGKLEEVKSKLEFLM